MFTQQHKLELANCINYLIVWDKAKQTNIRKKNYEHCSAKGSGKQVYFNKCFQVFKFIEQILVGFAFAVMF